MENQSQLVYTFVSRKLYALALQPDSGSVKAALAELRRGIGRLPGDLPTLWGQLLEDLPPELQSKTGQPTYGEWAVYTALTLYALHQQGHDLAREPMAKQGQRFGCAVRLLVPPGDEAALLRVQRRFNAMSTAADLNEAAYHLRGLIQLLRAAGIPLDYPALAVDLYWLQFEETAPGVRLRWGQDFYRIVSSAAEPKAPANAELSDK